MATLDQLHLPDELLAAIRQRAAVNGITLEEQVLRDLALAESIVPAAGGEPLLDEIRRDRQAMRTRGVWLTDEFLREAKGWGRE